MCEVGRASGVSRYHQEVLEGEKASGDAHPYLRLFCCEKYDIILRNIPLETAKITIDGRATKQYQKATATYLRREINNDNSKKLEFKFDDSVTTDLLQLADLIAGSINRSLQPDKTDSKTYISILKDKIIKIQKITFR